MWTPLAVAAALAAAPAQPPAQPRLALSNLRATFGELGGTRPDAPLVPGDTLFFAFDIDGIAVAANGQVEYEMALEVADAGGRPVFRESPAVKRDYLPLGGAKLPARAYVSVGLDQPPGQYVAKLTVTDKATKASDSLRKKFAVAGPGFGIVNVFASADDLGRIPAPTTGVVGQSVFVQFGVVGFRRAAPRTPPKGKPATPRPDVKVEMRVLDASGNPTLEKPAEFAAGEDVDEKDPGFALRFLLPLTRAGDFTVRLTATDRVAGKSATFDLPLAVVPPAN